MKKLNYVPSEIGFSGSIILNVPLYEDRLDMLDELNLIEDEEGKYTVSKQSSIKMFAKMLRAARKFYETVDLKYELDGVQESYQSYEDLSSDPKCMKILQDVANKILSAGAVGNA